MEDHLPERTTASLASRQERKSKAELRLADCHGSTRQAAMPHLCAREMEQKLGKNQGTLFVGLAADFVEQQDVVLDLLPEMIPSSVSFSKDLLGTGPCVATVHLGSPQTG